MTKHSTSSSKSRLRQSGSKSNLKEIVKDGSNLNSTSLNSSSNAISPRISETEDFRFVNYAGKGFANLRERFGILNEHFLLSLCVDKSLAMVGTPGKSGSLFFFSLDMQYILKTINKKESKFFREVLPSYYNVYPFFIITFSDN